MKKGKYTEKDVTPPMSKHGSNGGNGGYDNRSLPKDIVDPRKKPSPVIAGNARMRGKPMTES